MTITARIQEKIDGYRRHVLMAVDYLSKGMLEEAAVRFRKSGEAYCKAVIYERLGDGLGHDVILGHKKQDGSASGRRKTLLFIEMIELCSDERNTWIDAGKKQLLNDIREKTNENAHDSNDYQEHSALKAELENCFNLSVQLTNHFYAQIGTSIPTELKSAYTDGVVDSQTISQLQLSDIDSFVEQVESFDRSSRYILVAPFSTQGVSEPLLRNLMAVSWSMVIDFNCRSQESGGLYHAMLPTIEDNCTPFTILNKDNLVNMSKGTNGNINWIYANGLANVSGTVTADINGWIGKRMHHFLRDALTEFCKKSLSRIHIISLLDDVDYLAELIRQFDGIDFAERDLVTFSIITNKEQVRTEIEKLSRYGFEIHVYHFTTHSFLSQMGDFLQPEERHAILIPGRNTQGENCLKDVTSIYSKLQSNGISIIHRDIVAETASQIDTIPAFYRGETITWSELEADVDVQRSKYDELQRKVLERLNGRQSQKFQLYHRAGAGGTTISRRLAYNLRETVPTIIINEYVKGVTFDLIELLSMTVNSPMLAIAESSKVGNIDDLIAECNAKKRMVVFVYVERILRKPNVICQPQLEYITDHMHDAEEKGKFSYKVQLYHPNSQSKQWIDTTPYAHCEVIDFSMTIAEQNYKRDALRSYVRQYLNQLSEPVAEFLAYVSLIYYYAQRSVSDLVFRKIFVTDKGQAGLLQYMRHHQQEMPYLKKLITDDSDGQNEERQWRPRYSVFADIMLEELLGGAYPDRWKIALPEWTRKLIKTVKVNYEYLTDEVKKMLVAVFLEREKEDLLGREELWGARGAQEKFSLLLEDLSPNMDDQKAVLKLLAESYPTVSHFWGHLARYCYENADTTDQFNEAAAYIDNALDKNGVNDFNLLHIAGMCRRRMIEYYYRRQEAIEMDELKRLTETSRGYFRQSREVNPRNVHAYTSEIQLLTIVIEYGKSLSDYDKYSTFLVDHNNIWFFELYQDLNDLIDELASLVEQLSTLGITKRINRTKAMLAKSESKSWEYIGNYKESLRALQEHIRTADRLSLPRLRALYVRTLLMSKVEGKRENMMEAWGKLSPNELNQVYEYLNKNVQQSSGDITSMRLWIQLVRYSGVDITIDEVKSRLNMMYKSSSDYPMAQLEAAFNLYIFNLFELIRDNDTLNSRKKEDIQRWINICKELSSSDKYPFEWLVSLDDISGIVSSRNKPDFNQLECVSGTITDIKSNAQGIIRLDCGFDVFFTPSVGNFIQGKDETTRVEMAIAFRHEGPAAYEVARLNRGEGEQIDEMAQEAEQDMAIGEIEAIDPKKDAESNPMKEFASDVQKENKPRLAIIGKIDLDQFKKYERPEKRRNK